MGHNPVKVNPSEAASCLKSFIIVKGYRGEAVGTIGANLQARILGEVATGLATIAQYISYGFPWLIEHELTYIMVLDVLVMRLSNMRTIHFFSHPFTQRARAQWQRMR